MPRKKSASSLGAFALLGLIALCCGGPCALINRSPPTATAIVEPSSETTTPATPTDVPRAAVHDEQRLQPVTPPNQAVIAAPSESTTQSASTLTAEKPPPERTLTVVTQPKPVRAVRAAAAITPELPVREWTAKQGGFHTSASFVRFIEGKAQLKKAAGGMTTVPLDKLSTPDRQYVKDVLRVDSAAKVITGKIVGVTDGDTLTILDEENVQHKIRLEGIDAPESGQAFGTAAKQVLSAKIFGQFPWIEWRERDKYGRTLGHIYLDGRHINLEMVADGYAWHYKEYSKDIRLANAEIVAKKKRKGLWISDAAIPPWEFRRTGDSGTINSAVAPAQNISAFTSGGNEAILTVYVTTSGQKYHRDGCRHLAKSKIPILLSDARDKYGPCSTCSPSQ